MEFDHIGVPAPARRDGMRFLESKRLWLTSPADYPFRVVFGEVRVGFIEVTGCRWSSSSPTDAG